jgi:hypothetical protein
MTVLLTACRWTALGFTAGGLLSFQHIYHLSNDNATVVALRLQAMKHYSESQAALLRSRLEIVDRARS